MWPEDQELSLLGRNMAVFGHESSFEGTYGLDWEF